MVSIIIVNYHVKKELLICIESLIASKSKTKFEIIVVDNDEEKSIERELQSNVVYIPNENKGFGQGNNVGAEKAKGEFLFFLNPDTTVFPDAIDNLVKFLENNRNAAIVAPLLLGKDGKAYQQGALELTPLRGIFALSFFNKLWPSNPIAKKYFLSDWDRKTTEEVTVAPGTAFMISKKMFEDIGGFDEKFFLYFEEFDLCKRIKKLGKKIFIYPKAHVSHLWGVSTKQRRDIDSIFAKSRFYYFKKHFGLIAALFTESFFCVGKYTVVLAAILLLGAFLRLHNIAQTMPFIGDQGWFYLSARDMVLTGQIPLVGIVSSHPWLHQGALWTYLLAGWLWLFQFNPVSGAYLSGMYGLFGVLGMYGLGGLMFSRRVGLIAAALFATSPLIVLSDRMPYHTSPIPLFTIVFIYFLYKWIHGSKKSFPFIIATLGILYNLELATALLWMVAMAIWLYGYVVKNDWARGTLSPKSLVFSLIAFILSMFPMIIYDMSHGFPQTVKFVGWIGYKILVLLGYPPINPSISVSWNEMGIFFGEQIKNIVFPYNWEVALGIFIFSLIFLLRKLLDSPVRGNDKIEGMTIIFVLNSLLVVGFFVAKTPSGAYLPMLFPGVVLLVALLFDWLIKKAGIVRVVGMIGLLSVVAFNSYFLVSHNYSFHKGSDNFTPRLSVAKQIVKEAGGKEYNLKGRGRGSQFESFTMNYEYLTWWLGNGPSKTEQPLNFIISETKDGIKIIKAAEIH